MEKKMKGLNQIAADSKETPSTAQLAKDEEEKVVTEVQSNKGISEKQEPIVMKFNFTPEKIMMMLSKERLMKLEKIWEDYPDGLELPLFTQLMVDSIACSEDEEKYELMHGALKLFSEVDINGDMHMEWDEFMQYIIDAVMETSIQSGDAKQSVLEMISQMKENKFARFALAYNPLDKSKHSNYILSAELCAKPNLVYCFEKYSKELKFYGASDLKLKEKHKVPLRVEGFILGIAYSDSQLAFGCTATDRIQSNIWALNKHKVWITAGRDFKLTLWDPFKAEHLLATIDFHTDEVMDVCELEVPFCIATCSFDKKIMLYSIQDREILRVLEGDHITGIKRLAYSASFGGHLVSVGHEIYANVWGPESLISEILIGKLKGHTKPIIDTKFIGKSPFNVTLDESNQIRIWDIKSLSCIQSIKAKISTAAQGLVVVTNNILWIYGKRIIQFDTYSTEENEDGGGQNDQNPSEIYPIWAEFNTYYQNFNVVNKDEVKLYESSNGKLIKIHSGLVASGNKVEITQFKLDLKHRKFYLADTQGLVKVYNIANGVILKDVNPEDNDEDGEDGEDGKDGKSDDSGSDYRSEGSFGSSAKKSENDSDDKDDITKNKEITSMQLIWEEDYIQMICTDQKYLYIYDEDDTEESNLMRQITGAHTEEITIVKYDDHLSLIATGSINGDIAIWDFEMSKLEGFCFSHTGDITGLEFLAPNPILVSSSMDGTVCVWGVRPVSIHYKHVCLYRFSNMSWKYDKDVLTPVTKLIVFQKEMEGIKRHNRIKNGLFGASKYGNFNLNFLFSKIEQKLKTNVLAEHDKIHKHRNTLLSTLLRPDVPNETSIGKQTFITQTPSLIDDDYDKQIGNEKMRVYIYVADELGFLKVWDLTHIVAKLGFKQAPNYPQTKISFNPKRCENIDCTKYATSLRNEHNQSVKLKQIKLVDIVDAENAKILIREVKAHKECILCLNPVMIEQGGLITTSIDKRVRIWSLHLDLWGTLNQKTEQLDKNWCFPQDFKMQQKATEIEQVKELLDEVKIDVSSPNKNIIFSTSDAEDPEKEVADKGTAEKNRKKFKLKQAQQELKNDGQILAEKIAEQTKKSQREIYLQQINSNSVIYNINKKVAEFNLRMKLMQVDFPMKYDGFAAHLEKKLDEQQSSRQEKHSTQQLETQLGQSQKQSQNFSMQDGHNSGKYHMSMKRQSNYDIASLQKSQLIANKSQIKAHNNILNMSGLNEINNNHMQTLKNSPSKKTSLMTEYMKNNDKEQANDLKGEMYDTADIKIKGRFLSKNKDHSSNLLKKYSTTQSKVKLSRNIDTLNNDKSAILLFGDVPNLRDKVFSLTNKKQPSKYSVTPLRLRQDPNQDSNLSNYNSEMKDNLRSRLLLSNKLPPMNNIKQRNASNDTREIPSSRNLSQMMRQQMLSGRISEFGLNPNPPSYSIRENSQTLMLGERKASISSGAAHTLAAARNFNKHKFLTMDVSQGGDAVHIATDYIVDDYCPPVRKQITEKESIQKKRKQKYFGENSMLKLLYDEEKNKLEQQRVQLRMNTKLPKYPTPGKGASGSSPIGKNKG